MDGQVDRGDIASTDPREEEPCRIGMSGERREGLLVLLLRRGGLLQTRPVGAQDGQPVAPDVGPESRDMALGIQGKKAHSIGFSGGQMGLRC